MRTSRLLAIAAAGALALGLVACSTPASSTNSSGSGSDASDGGFPVTISHAYGETTIPKKPVRVATVGWANHEVPLALGVVPVGMEKATWADDDGDGVLPWVEDKLKELGAETPVLFDNVDGPDYEAIADTRPDVILSAYSGLSKEEYDRLSKIAPVIAYPGAAWGTSLDEMIEMDSRAIGLEKEGKALIEQLRSEAETALDAHSELKDKKVLFAWFEESDLSQVGYYTPTDPRDGYLRDLGLPMPQIIADNKDSSEFYLMLSAEEADKLDDVDLIVTYGDDSTLASLQADPLLSKVPAIAEGHVAVLDRTAPLAAAANASPLSVSWGISDYFDLMSSALAAQ